MAGGGNTTLGAGKGRLGGGAAGAFDGIGEELMDALLLEEAGGGGLASGVTADKLQKLKEAGSSKVVKKEALAPHDGSEEEDEAANFVPSELHYPSDVKKKKVRTRAAALCTKNILGLTSTQCRFAARYA